MTATPHCCRGRDLLSAALHGELTPIPPVSFWRHHPVADQDTDAFVASTVDFQTKVECDFVKVTPASSYQTRDYGLLDEWRPDGIGRRTITYRPVASETGWLELPLLNPGQGFAGRIVEAARRIRRRIDREIPVLQTVFSPVFQAGALAARPLSAHNREFLAEGLSRLTANTITLIEAFLDAGVDGFYFAMQHAQRASLPWDGFLRWGANFDAACLRAMGSALKMVHLHGNGVYLDACPPGAEILHYDCASDNPPVAAVQRRFAGVVASAPPRLPERRFVYCPGCAIPLAEPDEATAAWAARVRTAAVK